MVAPVANPPAPDVEAVARAVIEPYADTYRISKDGRFDGRSVFIDLTQNIIPAIASALTAHTASLQARVEELERALETAAALIGSEYPRTAETIRAALRPADEPVTQREM